MSPLRHRSGAPSVRFACDARIVLELTVIGTRLRLDVVHRGTGPKRTYRKKVQLHEVAFAAVKIEMLRSVVGFTSMFWKSRSAAKCAEAKSS
jgi:hypothetical protein